MTILLFRLKFVKSEFYSELRVCRLRYRLTTSRNNLFRIFLFDGLTIVLSWFNLFSDGKFKIVIEIIFVWIISWVRGEERKICKRKRKKEKSCKYFNTDNSTSIPSRAEIKRRTFLECIVRYSHCSPLVHWSMDFIDRVNIMYNCRWLRVYPMAEPVCSPWHTGGPICSIVMHVPDSRQQPAW